MWCYIVLLLLIAESVKASLSSIEAGLDNGVFVDFKRRDSHYECITVMAVRSIIDKVSTSHNACEKFWTGDLFQNDSKMSNKII